MRIFISYARVDRNLVQQLVDVLREVGHDPWFDHLLQSGQAWQSQLWSAIKDSDLFMYALTPESIESKWCQWEFAEAIHLGKPIIPVLMQGKLELPDALKSHQCADFTEGLTVRTVARLVNDLRDAQPVDPAYVSRLPVPNSKPEHPLESNANTLALADRLYKEAFVAYRDKAYDEAYDLLVDCLALDPNYVDAQALLKIVEGRRSTVKYGRSYSDADEPINTLPIGDITNSNWAELLRQFRKTAGFPVPEMVHVPAGRFILGSDPKHDPIAERNEQPQISLHLPEFFIGRYPVTVGEYQIFVEHGGYSESRWWTAAGWSWKNQNKISNPSYWNDEKWTHSHLLPVVGVSWFEAYAFSLWLDNLWKNFLKATGTLLLVASSHSLMMRLPTEPEWEKAARSIDGRIYPWGDRFSRDLCNIEEAGIGNTTPVGQFSPNGDSPYGCADMAGNVWEWCLTIVNGDIDNPKMWNYRDGLQAVDNSVIRSGMHVQRGGAWDFDYRFARSAGRFGHYSESRYDNFGFRMCVGPKA